jgi:hypothetical protein
MSGYPPQQNHGGGGYPPQQQHHPEQQGYPPQQYQQPPQRFQPASPGYDTPNTANVEGGYPDAGSPTTPAADPNAERELDALRGKVFPAAVSHLVLGMVCIPFCWVGYGFVVLLSVFLIIVGSVGVTHLSSMSSMRFSTCCCFPLNAVRQLHTWYVVSCIFAGLAALTTIIQLVVDDNVTRRVFSAIAMVLAFISLAALLYGAKAIAVLRDRCLLDELMIAGPYHGHVVATNGPVNNGAMVAPAPAHGNATYQPQFYPQTYTVYAVPHQQHQHPQPVHPYQQQQQQHQHHHHAQSVYPPPPPPPAHRGVPVGTPVVVSAQPSPPSGSPATPAAPQQAAAVPSAKQA